MTLHLTRVEPGFYRALGGRVEIRREVSTQTKTRHGKTVGYRETTWVAVVDGSPLYMHWDTKADAVRDAERALALPR